MASMGTALLWQVRKLEFLMADAKAKGADCVITIGGIQSNHCRATAVAARYLALDVHLILRNNAREADRDPGLVGNLLLDRMVGAHIHQVDHKGKFCFHESVLGHKTRVHGNRMEASYGAIGGGVEGTRA